MKQFSIITIIILFLFSESVLSQDKKDKTYFQLKDNYRERLQEELGERKGLIEREFVLEDAIDPAEYVVGPGDIMVVYIWGEQESLFEIMVLPEGNIIIPSIGSIDINKKSLASAKNLIIEKAKLYYPGAVITVSLTGMRKFKIHISGEVLKRGSFDASPVDRISNVAAMAQGFTSWADKRSIEIKHPDGTTEAVNLLEFEQRGDISQNPLVRGGDIIYIPRINLSDGMVFISGNIGKPGYYQLYEGETIGGLIERINIEKETTDWEHAHIKREPLKNMEIKIPLAFIDSRESASVPPELVLKHNDIIFLPKKINEVYVFGAVRSPGAYPFNSNMKSGDYVGLAGKTERSASSSSIKVIRGSEEKVLKGPDVEVERGDKIEVPIRKIELTKDYLQIIGTFTSILIAAKAVGVIK